MVGNVGWVGEEKRREEEGGFVMFGIGGGVPRKSKNEEGKGVREKGRTKI